MLPLRSPIRLLVALLFGIATLLCCCRTIQATTIATATKAAHSCCSTGQNPTPHSQDHRHECPHCGGTFAVAHGVVRPDKVAQDTLPDDVLPPPVLADEPLVPLGEFASSVTPPAHNPVPRPTLVSLHTCLLW